MPNTAVDLIQQASLFLQRAEAMLGRLETLLPPTMSGTPNWQDSPAFRWRRNAQRGWLEPIANPQRLDARQLQGIDDQRSAIERNTAQFVAGRSANNVLLTGARGTGKSSLIKAMLHQFSASGLRMIEVEKHLLADLPDIIQLVSQRPERFIIFCDDLSFDENDNGYMALKTALDGSLAATPDNLLIYATSNRRHLLPESQRDNQSASGADLHPGETVDEKIALSDRFGLWLSFYAFDQDTYLACVRAWLAQLGIQDSNTPEIRHEALLWALTRSNRSGRSAWQFARDYAGRR